MFLFKQAAPMRRALAGCRLLQSRIGFVPTMGALHEGHLDLVRRSKEENELTVVSIFVNPTQFNDSSDLQKYPRTPSKDIELLLGVGTDILFLPEVEEIYPPGMDFPPPPDLNPLDRILEGAFRPGHFAGVAQVVERLLALVEPHHLYMGQKDYQQLLVVSRLIEQRRLKVKLAPCATVREADGLAMSSRNRRLSADNRLRAPAIYQALREVQQKWPHPFSAELESQALAKLREAGLEPEYFQIVDRNTLAPINGGRFAEAVACTAVWAGDVRLIDNILLGAEQQDGAPGQPSGT